MEDAIYFDSVLRKGESFPGVDLHDEGGEVMMPSEDGSAARLRLWSREKIMGEEMKGQEMPPNPYVPKVEYDGKWETSQQNPKDVRSVSVRRWPNQPPCSLLTGCFARVVS